MIARKRRILSTATTGVLALGVLLAGQGSAPAEMSADRGSAATAAARQVACRSGAPRVTAITNPATINTAVAYNSNPARFHSPAILETTISVGGTRNSCLIAHFSTLARPLDNWIVFQVRVDGKPMKGHAPGFANVAVPVVFDPDESGAQGPWRMVAYEFFETVKPGKHRVQVLFAGCCSGNQQGSGAAVQSPVLTLEHA